MKLQNKLILSFLIFSNIIFCQQNQDMIVWKVNILEWKHFQNLPQDNNISNARSNVNITSRWKVTNQKLSAIILSEFSKSKSWLRGKETKDLLKHEQGHFDIIEYYSRLFRKELATYKFESLKNLKDDMSALHKKYIVLSKEMQEFYDSQTNHSLLKEQQNIWNLKIDKLLQETNNFSNPEVTVDLSYLK